MPKSETEIVRTQGGKPQRKAAKARRFGKREKQIFLDALSENCNIAASAKACGFSTTTIDRHRKSDATFRGNVLAALASGYERLELAMLERAIHGVEEDIWHAGKPVGKKTSYNDAMALRLLALHRDTVKGVPGESEEELEETYKAARAELEKKLDEMRERLGYDD